jgi:hypothetical protein
MGKYNGTDVLACHTPLGGKQLKISRGLYMDLERLGGHSINMLEDLVKDINTFDKYDDIDMEYSDRSCFTHFPSYNNLTDKKQLYREGMFFIDFSTFAMGCFIDCLNINHDNRIMSVFIVHY